MCCLSLFGCNSTLELKPDSGKNIKVEFLKGGQIKDKYGGIDIYQDDYDCFGFAPKATLFENMPATKLINVSGRKFLTVATNYRYFVFTGLPLINVNTCNQTLTFPIEEGYSYKLKTSIHETECALKVERVSLSNRALGAQSVETKTRQRVTPFSDGHGPWCTPESSYQGSSSLTVPRGP